MMLKTHFSSMKNLLWQMHFVLSNDSHRNIRLETIFKSGNLAIIENKSNFKHQDKWKESISIGHKHMYSKVYFVNATLRSLQGITPIEPCGIGYWVLSSFQIPLAVICTTWILCRKENLQHHTLNQKVFKIWYSLRQGFR